MEKAVGGNTMLLRSLNRSLVLDTIRRSGAISRADIARRTNLTSAAIGSIVGNLVAEGFLLEQADETARPAAGRPPVLVGLNPDAAFSVGVNVGITKVTAVLADLTGHIRARDRRRLQGYTPEAVVDTVAKAVAAVTAGCDRAGILGIGVGLHGIVDAANGVSRFAPHYGWRNVAIAGMLERATGMSVVIENGVRTMLLGEAWFGAARGLADVVCVAVGAGIGAGFLSEGRLLRGPSGAAGEIGHTTVDSTGPRCSCGNFGCLETVASGPAIVRNALKLIKQGQSSLLTDLAPDLESLDAAQVAAAAEQGDAVATRVLEDAGRYLGLSVANLCNTLDVRHILLGGGVSRSGPAFLETLENTVKARVLDMGSTSPVILTAQLGDEASPLGGATLALDRFFQTGTVAQQTANGRGRF